MREYILRSAYDQDRKRKVSLKHVSLSLWLRLCDRSITTTSCSSRVRDSVSLCVAAHMVEANTAVVIIAHMCWTHTWDESDEDRHNRKSF